VTRLSALVWRLLEIAVVALLAFMVVIVFLNVVLRYGFDSGIHLSDELSRFALVWLTFLGAVLTLRDNGHVNIETLVARLSRRGRLVCMAATQVIILICSVAMLLGTIALHPLNATMRATVSGIPMNWVSDVLGVGAVGVGLIAATRLVRILTGRMTQAELDFFAGQHGADDGK
jgi:TRAP-type transport system small permease protein